MNQSLSPADFLREARRIPVIDVRSPAEYASGHIPGAVSIPLFDDDERAVIGTLYHHSGREAAVLRGLELAGPKLARFLKELKPVAHGKEVLIHCWRGGMRSESMAWLFSQGGYAVATLQGGYKAYRRYIRERWDHPLRIIVLGGNTGSGKTAILKALHDAGEQVVDLESVACHRGSVYGGLGQLPQPSNEQFENNLSVVWENLDPRKPVWIEDESRMIGTVSIPAPLYQRMNASVMIRIEVDRETRIRRLLDEYAGFDPLLLQEKTARLAEKLGGTLMKTLGEAFDRQDLPTVVAAVLDYYDKTYTHAVSRRMNPEVHSLPFSGDDPSMNAMILLGYADSLNSDSLMPYGTSLS